MLRPQQLEAAICRERKSRGRGDQFDVLVITARYSGAFRSPAWSLWAAAPSTEPSYAHPLSSSLRSRGGLFTSAVADAHTSEYGLLLRPRQVAACAEATSSFPSSDRSPDRPSSPRLACRAPLREGGTHSIEGRLSADLRVASSA